MGDLCKISFIIKWCARKYVSVIQFRRANIFIFYIGIYINITSKKRTIRWIQNRTFNFTSTYRWSLFLLITPWVNAGKFVTFSQKRTLKWFGRRTLMISAVIRFGTAWVQIRALYPFNTHDFSFKFHCHPSRDASKI